MTDRREAIRQRHRAQQEERAARKLAARELVRRIETARALEGMPRLGGRVVRTRGEA